VGADIDAYAVGEHEPVSQHSFSGGTLHISKVRGGGVSSGHYHRRTENLWDRNARESAQAVAEAMDTVGADLVLVGGDDKAAALLRDHLDGLTRAAEVRTVSGGRADAGAMRSLRTSVDHEVEAVMRRNHEQVLTRFTDALPGGPAAQGMPAVKDALAAGRVEVLLLAANRGTEPPLWGSRSDPMIVATDPAALRPAAPGAADSHFKAPATAMLLRAAAEGGAQFTELLPGTHAHDGVGAILRY
jgi:peptide subunit release factor 1 (eRF1)